MGQRAKEYRTVTISVKDKDLEKLQKYIEKQQNRIDPDSPINRSLVIRKALEVLYRIDKPFDKIN